MWNRFRRRMRAVVSGAVCACAMLTAAGLAGCNTTEGVGRDLQSAGEGIEDAADRNK